MTQQANTPLYDVLIVGAGISGIGLGIRLREAGFDNFVILEKAADLGGTWRDNTYPGCACDIPSNLYSFSFAPNPRWSRAFSQQAELHRYLRDTAVRFGVMPHIVFDAEVLGATWMEDDQEWEIETRAGTIRSQFLISGAGPLSEPSYPDVPGIEDFQGTMFHSAQWNHDHDLSGERVAVLGTGASAVQFVPHVAEAARELTVFQRTPPWILPRPDRNVPELQKRLYNTVPALQKAVRIAVYWRQEAMLPGLVHRPGLLRAVEKLALAHMHWKVKDPELRRKLTPDYKIGCKRILIANDYYPALTRPNVSVVTESVERINPHSITTRDGREHAIDTLIFGTGFHVTDTSISDRIRGRAAAGSTQR